MIVTLIADLVDSRQIDNRALFQQELGAQLERCNKTAAARLLSPFTLTLGDEFQAVYKGFADCHRELVQLMANLFPIQIRAVLVKDVLSTEINKEAALEMDGPAFHQAREMMNALKKQKRSIMAVGGHTSLQADFANAGLTLLANQWEGWKRNTWLLLDEMVQGGNLVEMQERSGLKERAVYKQLAGHRLQDQKRFLDQLFRQLDGDAKG